MKNFWKPKFKSNNNQIIYYIDIMKGAKSLLKGLNLNLKKLL